jgi:hypothetical protein
MLHRWVGCAVALAAILLGFSAPSAFSAEKAAKPGTKAILEVEFTLSGSHSESSQERSIDWKVNRTFKATFEIKAQELAKYGFLDQSHQKEMQDDNQALGQQAQQMTTNNADMMAKAQAIADACGDDEACIQQKVMELAQDPNSQGDINQLSTDGQAMSESIQANDAKSPPRYQLWKDPNNKAPKGKGSASLKESLVEKTFDPACAGDICTKTRDRDGSQEYDSAKEAALTMTMVEVDTANNRISLSIPWPVVMISINEVTQDGGGKKTIPLANAQQLEMIQKHTNIVGRPIKGSYKDQSGEDSFQLPSLEDYEAPIDVKLRWHFKVL